MITVFAVAIDLNELRAHVYRQFAEHARAVRPDEVAAAFGVTAADALDALRALDDAHLLVLDPGRRRIVMAHPWAAGPMGFVVASDTQKWWGGCAWDSFAIPALVGSACLVATHCPACARVLALDVRPDVPPGDGAGEMVAQQICGCPCRTIARAELSHGRTRPSEWMTGSGMLVRALSADQRRRQVLPSHSHVVLGKAPMVLPPKSTTRCSARS